jgi:ketosteroid isomerase-like protein
MADSPLDVIRTFSRHFDERDVEGAVLLLANDVEAVTPRGTQHGPESFRVFMARQTYGVTPVVQSRRYFVRGDAVVVGMRTQYVYVEGDEPAGAPEDGAALYLVREGLIRRFQPFGNLAAALDAAGMTAADEAAD